MKPPASKRSPSGRRGARRPFGHGVRGVSGGAPRGPHLAQAARLAAIAFEREWQCAVASPEKRQAHQHKAAERASKGRGKHRRHPLPQPSLPRRRQRRLGASAAAPCLLPVEGAAGLSGCQARIGAGCQGVLRLAQRQIAQTMAVHGPWRRLPLGGAHSHIVNARSHIINITLATNVNARGSIQCRDHLSRGHLHWRAGEDDHDEDGGVPRCASASSTAGCPTAKPAPPGVLRAGDVKARERRKIWRV